MSDINARLRAAGDALRNGDEDPALSLLADCRADPHVRVHVTRNLAVAAVDVVDRLRSRQKTEPDDPDLWLLTGAAHTEAGYRARGYAVAALTSSEQMRGMADQIDLARPSLHRAATLLPDDPAPWVILMTCAQVAGGAEQVGEAWQQVLARGGGEIYEANRARLVSLTTKWYGSVADCFAFARGETARLPQGHPLHAMIALAHIETYAHLLVTSSMPGRIWTYYSYLRRFAVRAEIRAASERLLAGAAEFADHPATPEAHQAFACVYFLAGAHRRARPHLARSGAVIAFPWRYFGEPRQVFARAELKAR